MCANKYAEMTQPVALDSVSKQMRRKKWQLKQYKYIISLDHPAANTIA